MISVSGEGEAPNSDLPLSPVLSVPEGYERIGTIGVRTDDLSRYVWVGDVNRVFTHPCDALRRAGRALRGRPCQRPGSSAVTRRHRSGSGDRRRYDGLYVELSVPDDVDVNACPSGVFGLWPGRAQRLQEILGQVDMVWILDVEGQRITIDAAHMPDVTPDKVAALRDMVTTATFAPADGATG